MKRFLTRLTLLVGFTWFAPEAQAALRNGAAWSVYLAQDRSFARDALTALDNAYKALDVCSFARAREFLRLAEPALGRETPLVEGAVVEFE